MERNWARCDRGSRKAGRDSNLLQKLMTIFDRDSWYEWVPELEWEPLKDLGKKEGMRYLGKKDGRGYLGQWVRGLKGENALGRNNWARLGKGSD